MQLIEQRTTYDCWIACAAMAAGLSYDYVLEKVQEYLKEDGMREEVKSLQLLGYTFTFENDGNNEFTHTGTARSVYKPWEMSPQYFRQQIWGRRAIVSVPSLNYLGKFHSIYWHYDQIFDPSPKVKYKTFTQLLPVEMILFNEGVGACV